MGGDTALAHAVGDLADELGGLFGDGFGRLARAERIGFGENAAERVEIGRFGEVGEAESVDVLGSAGEVGVDFEAVEVTDNQQRRVFEVFAVLEELAVGGGEVFVFAFVFPAEVAAEPDVGPTLAAFGFVDAALEGVPAPSGSAAAGLGWPSRSQRSQKCCW